MFLSFLINDSAMFQAGFLFPARPCPGPPKAEKSKRDHVRRHKLAATTRQAVATAVPHQAAPLYNRRDAIGVSSRKDAPSDRNEAHRAAVERHVR
jgi:hypothetical protein